MSPAAFKTTAAGIPIKMAPAPTAKDSDFRSVVNEAGPVVISRPDHAHAAGEGQHERAPAGESGPPRRKNYFFHGINWRIFCSPVFLSRGRWITRRRRSIDGGGWRIVYRVGGRRGPRRPIGGRLDAPAGVGVGRALASCGGGGHQGQQNKDCFHNACDCRFQKTSGINRAAGGGSNAAQTTRLRVEFGNVIASCMAAGAGRCKSRSWAEGQPPKAEYLLMPRRHIQRANR